MSTYILHHDELNCIGCHACEVHCKTNKDLGPGPSPCKIITIGPVRCRRTAAHPHRLHAMFPLRGPVVRAGLPDRGHAEA